MILIIATYLAGVLTILSPCILPVLPFVFSKSQSSFLKSRLPLLAGMALTFSLFSAIAIVGGEWIGRANEVGRIVAMVLMIIFGLSMIFPHISETVLSPLTRFGARIGGQSRGDNIYGSFVIGISTGLLWAPCAGPILGLVLTGAASSGNLAVSIGLLLSYSLGAATSLSLALIAGNRFLGTLKKSLGVDQLVKKALGFAVLLGVIAVAFNLDRTVLTRISKIETSSVENRLLSAIGHRNFEENKPSNSMMMIGTTTKLENIAIEGELPDLSGASSWLNSKPLTREDLKGKVVLIDFWTYSCINCLRTLPYVKSWAEKYKLDGLVVIGVHTPEFAFEKIVSNVQNSLKDLEITYPIALDSDYKIWNAFKNSYWPAHYFVDRQGRIRHHHFGEGEYQESEKIIRDLLAEDGRTIHAQNGEVHAAGVQIAGSLEDVQSPETYVGYGRTKNFVAFPSESHDQIGQYESPKKLQLNQWALSGKWLVSEEKATVKQAHGKVVFRFHARDLHLVLGSSHTIKFKVTIDGHAPELDQGIDIDRNGFGEVNEHRLYQLIRQRNSEQLSDHLFEIEFLDSGVDVYAFTFG